VLCNDVRTSPEDHISSQVGDACVRMHGTVVFVGRVVQQKGLQNSCAFSLFSS